MQDTEGREAAGMFRIGVVGAGASIQNLIATLSAEDFTEAFPWVRLVGVVLSDRLGAKAVDPDSLGVRVHPHVPELLSTNPDCNMLFDLRADDALFLELRKTLPPDITLANRKTSLLIWDLLLGERRRRAAELELLQAETLFRTVFDEVAEDILLLDLQGRIVDLNRNVYARKGQAKEALLGRLCWDIEGRSFCCETNDTPCPYEQTLRTGQKADAIHSFVDDSGCMRYFRVYAYPIYDSHRQMTHVMEIRRDITNRTALEMRVQQSEKMAAIGELSTYIAHEIRNPLFAIGGFANSLLRSTHLSDADREKAEIILQESKRLDKILKSTLNFARPTDAAESRVNLNALATDCAELLGIGSREKGVEFRLEIMDNVAMAQGDADLIKNCCINLIKNALEALPGGGAITVRTGMNTHFVFIEVEDTGPGIPPELRDKVFNPFFSTKDQGAGLGLAMTKKIVEDMGGKVQLHSVLGQGTRVALFLQPVLAVDTPPPGAQD